MQSSNKHRLTGSRQTGEGRAAWLFMLPSLAGLCIFFLIPFADTLRRSFFDTHGETFAGTDSYASVMSNSAFQLAAKNTARFIGVCIPLLLAVSLALALLVRAISPKGRLLKTTYLLPMAVPVASIVLLWQVLFHKNGLVNAGLLLLGIDAVDFMETSAAFWVLVFTYIWKNSGYNMILWLAGLDGIPQSLYEAARVDGAGAWQCFWHITLPCLLPTLGLVSILSLLNSFKVFREAYLVDGAYPRSDSIYLLQHLFYNWFRNLDIARLCAAAVMLCAVLLVIILVMQRFLMNTEE